MICIRSQETITTLSNSLINRLVSYEAYLVSGMALTCNRVVFDVAGGVELFREGVAGLLLVAHSQRILGGDDFGKRAAVPEICGASGYPSATVPVRWRRLRSATNRRHLLDKDGSIGIDLIAIGNRSMY